MPAPALSTAGKATILAVSSLTVMAGATISPSLPAMQTAFADNPNADVLVPLTLTVPALAIALLGFPAGWLVDRFGRLRVLLAALVLYAASGSTGLYLESLPAILAGRALLGVSVAGVMTCSVTLVADYLSGEQRRGFMGTQAAFMGFGGVVFLILGGLLANAGWRYPFALYFASLILVPAVHFTLREPPRVRVARHHAPHAPPETPWGLIASILAIAFLGMAAFYLIPVHVPFYVTELAGATPSQAGFTIATATLVASFVSLNYRRVRARMGFRAIAALLFALLGTGYILLGLAQGIWTARAAMLVCGLGMGLLMPNMNVWLSGAAPEAIRGRAIGGLTVAVFLGQFVSPLLAQPILSANGYRGAVGLYDVAGYVTLAVGVILLVWKFAVRERV